MDLLETDYGNWTLAHPRCHDLTIILRWTWFWSPQMRIWRHGRIGTIWEVDSSSIWSLISRWPSQLTNGYLLFDVYAALNCDFELFCIQVSWLWFLVWEILVARTSHSLLQSKITCLCQMSGMHTLQFLLHKFDSFIISLLAFFFLFAPLSYT